MPPSGPPTEKEILNIARRTTDIIDDYITSNVCLFGSAASYLWADIGRVPDDIDIILWDEDIYLDPEEVKRSIVHADDRYYLEPSRKRGATHKILYCRLPGWATNGRRVKVDILVPPKLGFPEIDMHEQVHFDGIPVMPLLELLVTKTQGWWDHRTSFREDFRAKVEADVTDIYALLDRAMEEDVSYQDRHRLNPKFIGHGLTLARKFVYTYGQSGKWMSLGFPL